MKAWIIAGIVAAAIVFVPVASYISNANNGNRMEVAIRYQYDQVKNVGSRMSTSILEAVQVPEIAKNDIVEVITAATEGRYGADGAQNVVLAIQEANAAQIDPALYTRIQDLIASGRKDFEVEQKKLLDTKATYERELGNVWSGLWLRIAGYPRIDLDDYVTVTDERTNEIFSTGVDKPLQLGN